MKNVIRSALCLMLVLSMLLPVFTSCAAGRDWQYTKEDMGGFEELSGKARPANSEKTAFTITARSEEGFADVKASDFVLFCYSDIDFEKEKDDYVSYRVAMAHAVEADAFAYTDEGLSVTFSGDMDKMYAILVNKNAMKSGRFAVICLSLTPKLVEEEDRFEEEYINTYAVWDAIDLSLKIDAQILSMIVGSFSGSPVAVVSGAFGLASLLGGSLFGSEVTNEDVMKRLDEIDGHIAELEKRIDKNQDALISEDVIIEAGIDKVTLELYNQNWDKFVSDYLEPMQDLERAYTLYLQKALKSTATNGADIELHYNADGTLLSLTDPSPYSAAVKLNITDFPQAKAFLASHKNTVGNGFADAMLADLKDSRANAVGNLPGMTDWQFAIDAYQMILEKIESDYYAGDYGSKGYENAEKVYNAFLNFAGHISSEGSGKSILDDYIGRMNYIYNFASEMRVPGKNYLSNMRMLLDKYALMASRACTFAELNQEEIGMTYSAAASYIKDSLQGIEQYPENYSFITGCSLKGVFANSEYQIWGSATDPELKLFNISVGGYTPDGTTFGTDITDQALADSTEILKIGKRFEIMKSMGLAEGTLYDYLSLTGVMSPSAVCLCDSMKESGLIGNDIYRFLTCYNERDLKSSDKKAFRVKAVMHNSGSDYFTIGKYYDYRVGHDGDHWKGKILETKFVDALTGKIMDDTRVIVYARYSEGHWYWSTDERWCFLDRDHGASYFVLIKE